MYIKTSASLSVTMRYKELKCVTKYTFLFYNLWLDKMEHNNTQRCYLATSWNNPILSSFFYTGHQYTDKENIFRLIHDSKLMLKWVNNCMAKSLVVINEREWWRCASFVSDASCCQKQINILWIIWFDWFTIHATTEFVGIDQECVREFWNKNFNVKKVFMITMPSNFTIRHK